MAFIDLLNFLFFPLLSLNLLLLLLYCLGPPFLIFSERRDFVGQEPEALPGERVDCKEKDGETV